jgi:hypothetical protein
MAQTQHKSKNKFVPFLFSFVFFFIILVLHIMLLFLLNLQFFFFLLFYFSPRLSSLSLFYQCCDLRSWNFWNWRDCTSLPSELKHRFTIQLNEQFPPLSYWILYHTISYLITWRLKYRISLNTRWGFSVYKYCFLEKADCFIFMSSRLTWRRRWGFLTDNFNDTCENI